MYMIVQNFRQIIVLYCLVALFSTSRSNEIPTLKNHKYPDEKPEPSESWTNWAKRYSCLGTNFVLKDLECCTAPYVRRKTAVSNLRKTLDKEFFGQHLALEATLDALEAHLSSETTRSPLVLSFHGWSGSGKSYFTELLAEALYRNSVNSKFYRLFRLGHEFPFIKKDELNHHWNQFTQKLLQTGRRCEYTMFVFEEVDDTLPGILDGLIPYIDTPALVEGVSFKKSIFIFLSNVGATEINHIALEAWKQGRSRESLKLKEFENLITHRSFNDEGGLYRSALIHKTLMNSFIPFLPMEKEHIRECINQEADRQQVERRDLLVDLMADELEYWPEDTPQFSLSGCRKIEHMVKLWKVKVRSNIREREDL